MNVRIRFRAGDDVRALWLLAIFVLLGGSFFVQTHDESAIAASYKRIETLYRGTVADARVVRDSKHLLAVARTARADLSRISHDTSLSGSTATFLAALHASARTYGTRVLEVTPAAAQSSPPLDATPITIRISGRFRQILAFVEDLSHHATLIDVDNTELALAHGDGGNPLEPRLDATIHATLYRVHVPSKKGDV